MSEHFLNKDYRDMIECLLKAGVDFMLVGGYAVALHGWPRTTFDIDFWKMANPENAKAVVQDKGIWRAAHESYRSGFPQAGHGVSDWRGTTTH